MGGRESGLAMSSMMETVRPHAIVRISVGISSFQRLLQAFLAQV